MNKDNLVRYAALTVTVFGALLGVFLLFRYIFIPVLPFLIAWAVAFILRPAAIFLSKKTHIPRKAVSAALAIVTVMIGIAAVSGIAVWLLSEAWQLLSNFAADEQLFDFLSKLADPIGALFGDGEAAEQLEEHLGETIRSALSALLAGLVELLTAIVTRVPAVLFFILITVIASVYFSLDIDNINARVRGFLPKKAGDALVRFKDGFLSIGLKYVRSYSILMLITFVIMLIGFLILRVENAFLIALVVSLLDVLPLIGVGTVLVPWSIFQLLFGTASRGIGLIVLFVLNEIVRQFTEPRIVGKNLGIHPVISLLLLYVGYSVLGFAGLLLTPLVSVLLNVLFNKNNSTKID